MAASTGRAGLDACVEAVRAHLHEAPYTHEEVRVCARRLLLVADGVVVMMALW